MKKQIRRSNIKAIANWTELRLPPFGTNHIGSESVRPQDVDVLKAMLMDMGLMDSSGKPSGNIIVLKCEDKALVGSKFFMVKIQDGDEIIIDSGTIATADPVYTLPITCTVMHLVGKRSTSWNMVCDDHPRSPLQNMGIVRQAFPLVIDPMFKLDASVSIPSPIAQPNVPEANTETKPEIVLMDVNMIIPFQPDPDCPDKFKTQPRQTFDDAEIAKLAKSMTKFGQRHAVTVCPSKMHPGKFELVAGEQRWRAAIKSGIRQLWAMIKAYPNKRAQHMEAFVDNFYQPVGYVILDLSHAIQEQVSAGTSVQDIAEEVNRPVASIYKLLRLSNLHPDLKKLLISPEWHGKTISPSIAHELVRAEMTVQPSIWEQVKHETIKGLVIRKIRQLIDKKDDSGRDDPSAIAKVVSTRVKRTGDSLAELLDLKRDEWRGVSRLKPQQVDEEIERLRDAREKIDKIIGEMEASRRSATPSKIAA